MEMPNLKGVVNMLRTFLTETGPCYWLEGWQLWVTKALITKHAETQWSLRHGEK